MKKGFKDNIESATVANTDYRRVLYTSKHLQLVLMTLKPLEEIGFETHEENDQFFRFERGEGMVTINDSTYEVHDGDAVVVPAGSKHNVVNTSESSPLKLYTIYTPPHHRDGIARSSKSEAEADAPQFDGITTE